MKINRTKAAIAALAIVATAFSSAVAQNGTMTPYSRFGYGMLNDNATSAQKAMGGVGYAMNSGRQINVMNPASYAAIDSLTFLFDMGVNLTTYHASENSTSENNFGGGLDYITMQVPVGKHMGMSLGLLPYSSVGYAFGSSIDNGASSHSGSGSLNQLYLGWAVNPFKGMYAGFNFSYMFGSITNDSYAIPSTGAPTLFERSMNVSDWHLNIGLQYKLLVTNRDLLTLGLTYSPAKDLHGKSYGIYYYDTTNDDILPDTIPGDHKMSGCYSLPATWGAGINLNHAGKLMVEADFTYQPWKDAKFNPQDGFEKTDFANRWKVAVGAQYTPNMRGSYFQRVNYRIGAYFNHDYLTIKKDNVLNNVREYGISAGIGLPVPGFKSIVSLGIGYKHRQAHPNPLIKENYLNISLGINFNEMWFWQNKLN